MAQARSSFTASSTSRAAAVPRNDQLLPPSSLIHSRPTSGRNGQLHFSRLDVPSYLQARGVKILGVYDPDDAHGAGKQRLLDLGVDGLKAHIKTIGLFNSKAENIIKTCRILLEKFEGDVPRTRESLESLPGVGRKTANVILNTAFGEPTIAVDTHIFRVSNRTGIAKGKTPLEVEKRLVRLTPDEFKKDAHHWLILHGRYTCKARKPDCPVCVIADLCEYRHKTPAEDA